MPDNRDDGFLQTLAIISDSGVPREATRAIGNMVTSLSQAAASNPLAATSATIIAASALHRMRILDSTGRNILYGAAAGYLGVSQVETIGDAIGSAVSPFSDPVTTQQIAFDVPDLGGAPGSSLAALNRLQEARIDPSRTLAASTQPTLPPILGPSGNGGGFGSSATDEALDVLLPVGTAAAGIAGGGAAGYAAGKMAAPQAPPVTATTPRGETINMARDPKTGRFVSTRATYARSGGTAVGGPGGGTLQEDKRFE